MGTLSKRASTVVVRPLLISSVHHKIVNGASNFDDAHDGNVDLTVSQRISRCGYFGVSKTSSRIPSGVPGEMLVYRGNTFAIRFPLTS